MKEYKGAELRLLQDMRSWKLIKTQSITTTRTLHGNSYRPRIVVTYIEVHQGAFADDLKIAIISLTTKPEIDNFLEVTSGTRQYLLFRTKQFKAKREGILNFRYQFLRVSK